MKLIPLTKGFFAKVDDEDYERLSRFKWRVVIARKGTANPYAIRFNKGTRRNIFMHHEVLNFSVKGKLDHKDGDSLNNQKNNLRPATSIENGRNRRLQKHSAPYKGVALFKPTGKFQAYVCINKKPKHLGFFDTAEDAALVYDYHADLHYGEFALTNRKMGLI